MLLPAVGEAPVAAETEDGAEVAADDAVTQLEAELTYISQTIEAGKITLSNAQSALKTQEQLLDCIKQVMSCLPCHFVQLCWQNGTGVGTSVTLTQSFTFNTVCRSQILHLHVTLAQLGKVAKSMT